MRKDELWSDFMEIKDMMGDEALLEAILRAMTTDEMEEMLKFLRREYELDYEEDLIDTDDFVEA